MKGGDAKTIPTYNVDMNDPRIPNEQKEILKQRQPPPVQQPYISLQIAQPPKPKPIAPNPLQYLPQTTVYPQQFPTPYGMPLGTFGAPMNVVNQLVIGDQNPHQDHRYINMVYEDVLPLKHLPKSLTTVSERIILSDFIRSVVLKGGDGNIIPFRNGADNLYDRLNINELNPYKTIDDALTMNPYASLPKDMLIYRSCYPVQRSTTAGSGVSCANNSVGINLRIYRMTKGEMMINRTTDAKIYDSEIWREIMYYEYIRENILKTKQSQNFVMMFGYSLCNDSSIDFEEIEKIKLRRKGRQPTQPVVIHQPQPQQLIHPMYQQFQQQQVIKPNLQNYTNDILTAYTESPTYNIIQWATATYMNVGKSKKMINTGYHPDDTWISIIFQLLTSFITMLKHEIYITDFNINDNVYIKDLSGMSNVTTYWKYIIDGISYYIPNYGYLVMIDSKFKDIKQSGMTVGAPQQKLHKINGKFLDQGQASNINYQEKIMTALLNTVNSNNFNDRFVKNDGVKPSEKIILLLNEINGFINANVTDGIKAVQGCILKYFGKFVHNRVGTILTKQEQDDMTDLDKTYERGNIVIYEENTNVYKFGIYLGRKKIENGEVTLISILTKQNPNVNDFIRVDVMSGNVKKYPDTLQIRQIYKPNEAKLDETDLLETYVI